MPTKNPPIYDEGNASQPRVFQLEREVEDLRYMVRQLADASSFQNVVQQGFEELTERLAPLRDLAPTRAALRHDEKQLLHRTRAALARPDLTRPDGHIRTGNSGGSAQIGSTAS